MTQGTQTELKTLPQTGLDFIDWKWEDVEAHYQELRGRSINDGNVGEWLADWSRLKQLVDEGGRRLNVARTLDTADEKREVRYHEYIEQIHTPSEEQEQHLKEQLLESGLEPEGFEIPLRNLRAEADLFREANLPLLEEERKLSSEFDKTIGAQTVEWQGKEVTLEQLTPVLEWTNRDEREAAWRLARNRQLGDREALNNLWLRFLDLREQLASNADLPDYRAYRWRQLMRFDYSPDDSRSFHEAIEEVVVPAAARILERRKEVMGLHRLRPWDISVDKFGRSPLEPFENTEELISKCSAMFQAVHPDFGEYFATMKAEGLLDLENRKGKAPGGYQEMFAAVRLPFIFMNAVGRAYDIEVLLHEGGHAFHAFESASLPYYKQLDVPLEFAEVASMGMEFLSFPFIKEEHGGFYSSEDAARAEIDHLEAFVLFWPYMAVVDSFQHWVYENLAEARDPRKCDAAWERQWDRFMPVVDWDGLQEEKVTGWHRKLHIFHIPFYYVEYGLALLGAVQVWKNALEDKNTAVEQYRQALALGGTATLPELYRQAGAKLAFDADTLQEAVGLAERELERLRPLGEG